MHRYQNNVQETITPNNQVNMLLNLTTFSQTITEQNLLNTSSIINHLRLNNIPEFFEQFKNCNNRNDIFIVYEKIIRDMATKEHTWISKEKQNNLKNMAKKENLNDIINQIIVYAHDV